MFTVLVFFCVKCVSSKNQIPNSEECKLPGLKTSIFREVVQRCVKEEPGERPNMEEVIENLETEISFHPKLLL